MKGDKTISDFAFEVSFIFKFCSQYTHGTADQYYEKGKLQLVRKQQKLRSILQENAKRRFCKVGIRYY